jgi:hypothetical protein
MRAGVVTSSLRVWEAGQAEVYGLRQRSAQVGELGEELVEPIE